MKKIKYIFIAGAVLLQLPALVHTRSLMKHQDRQEDENSSKFNLGLGSHMSFIEDFIGLVSQSQEKKAECNFWFLP